jgi:hypothetical protein
MRENDKSKNDRCGFYFHSLNRICSGTTENERWIRENDISGNDRSRFHCIHTYEYTFLLRLTDDDQFGPLAKMLLTKLMTEWRILHLYKYICSVISVQHSNVPVPTSCQDHSEATTFSNKCKKELRHYLTRVEARSNTSTMTLQVIRGDEMGLKRAVP